MAFNPLEMDLGVGVRGGGIAQCLERRNSNPKTLGLIPWWGRIHHELGDIAQSVSDRATEFKSEDPRFDPLAGKDW